MFTACQLENLREAVHKLASLQEDINDEEMSVLQDIAATALEGVGGWWEVGIIRNAVDSLDDEQKCSIAEDVVPAYLEKELDK